MPHFRQSSGITAVELLLSLFLAVVLCAIAIPAARATRTKSQTARCVANLAAIDHLSAVHAERHSAFPSSLGELFSGGTVPSCPAGGTYTLGTPEGDPPRCSVPGHEL
jgi:competence protein ComGC